MSSNSTDSNQPQLQYNYIPTEWVAIAFLSLFGISTALHIFQALYSRLWWLFPSAVFCGLLEVTGWSGRVWSSQNPFLDKPYMIQAVTLVIAPTPLVAANFIALGRIIRRLGPQYSRLTPRRYTIIFVSCDIIALLVQGMGGSIAASNQQNQSQAQLGAHIALGGTIFQLVAIAVYCAFAAEFLYRFTWDRPVRRSAPVAGEIPRGTTDSRLKRMLQAMFVMTILIVIRTIYRVIEFVNGWNGTIISTEWIFDVFDGLMITVAMCTLNIFHPGIYLRDPGHSTPSRTGPEEVILEDRLKTTPPLMRDRSASISRHSRAHAMPSTSAYVPR